MQRSQDLLDAYKRAAAAIAQGTASPGEHLSGFSEVSSIGTDPDEWDVGREAVARAFETERQARGGQPLPATVGDPEAWAEQDFGWVIDRPVFRLPNGQEQRFRLTVICHRENGEWKVLHQHFSIGVPNEDVPVFQDG